MLDVESSGGVRTLRLNRPDRLNALTTPLLDALIEAISDAARSAEVGCVIVTGAGRGFCSGGDLRLNQEEQRRDAALPASERFLPTTLEAEVDQLRRWTAGIRLLRDMPKPSIAMINGPCAGAGMSIAGACDLRFAARSAVFVTAFADAGFSGDMGGSWYWSHIVGGAAARALFLLSERISAEAALAHGMVHRIVEDAALADETMTVAMRLAARPPRVHSYLKANINAAETEGIDAVLSREALAVMLSSGRWTRDERRRPPPLA